MERLVHGDSLVSDHILFAPASLHQLLSRLFTALLRNGFMPTALHEATIQPIPKGSKDSTLSANYRGIILHFSFLVLFFLSSLHILYSPSLLHSVLMI